MLIRAACVLLCIADASALRAQSKAEQRALSLALGTRSSRAPPSVFRCARRVVAALAPRATNLTDAAAACWCDLARPPAACRRTLLVHVGKTGGGSVRGALLLHAVPFAAVHMRPVEAA